MSKLFYNFATWIIVHMAKIALLYSLKPVTRLQRMIKNQGKLVYLFNNIAERKYGKTD